MVTSASGTNLTEMFVLFKDVNSFCQIGNAYLTRNTGDDGWLWAHVRVAGGLLISASMRG